MTQILWIGVCVVAVGLLATGLYFHLRRQALGSDPILIGSCCRCSDPLAGARHRVPDEKGQKPGIDSSPHSAVSPLFSPLQSHGPVGR